MNALQALQARYRVAADPLRTERRIELLVLVLCLVLCLQLVYGVSRLLLLSDPQPKSPAEGALRVRNVVQYQSVTDEESAKIRARPLFWVSRRPAGVTATTVVSNKPKAATPVKKIQGVKLVGMFGDGDAAGIILIVKGKKQRIMVGQEIDSWTFDSVEHGRAIFTSAGKREVLELHKSAIATPTVSESPVPDDTAVGDVAAPPIAAKPEETLSLGGWGKKPSSNSANKN
jgi:hypothetical protein